MRRSRLFSDPVPPSPRQRFNAASVARDLPAVLAALKEIPQTERFEVFEHAINIGWAPAVLAAYPTRDAWPADQHAAAGLSHAIVCGYFDLLAPLLARCDDPDAGEGEVLRWAAEDCPEQVPRLLTRMNPTVALPKLLEDQDWVTMDTIGMCLGDLPRMVNWLAQVPEGVCLPQTQAHVRALTRTYELNQRPASTPARARRRS